MRHLELRSLKGNHRIPFVKSPETKDCNFTVVLIRAGWQCGSEGVVQFDRSPPVNEPLHAQQLTNSEAEL
ncbi:hypothetical protein ACFX1T_008981 [Malus domestica]